jgi:endonuclease YncB( thermonuclease family)
LLQVGDGNRTYTVELACVSVEEDQQTEAIDWLRQKLPRRRRVNLRPVGSSNGQLVALVTPLGEENDVNTGLIAAGLATDGCAAELG